MAWSLILHFRSLLVMAMAASICAGLGNIFLIASINSALAPVPEAGALPYWFALSVLIAVIGRTSSGILFHRLSQSVLARLRSLVTRHVLAANLRDVERIGASKINSALTEDSTQVSIMLVSLPAVITNVVIVCGCLVYLAYLSWWIFVLTVCVICIGTFGYHRLHMIALADLRTASEAQTGLFQHFTALFGGAKELRLNAARRYAFSDDLLGGSIDTVRDRRIAGLSWFTLSAGWGSLLIYSFIGCVLFLLTGSGSANLRVATGFTLILFYIVTPLEVLLNNLPQINLARVAERRIASMLAALPLETELPKPDGTLSASATKQEIVLNDIVYDYGAHNDRFSVGPINLRLEAGELVFVVGGNGSGKTTFAKLLCGLYVPTRGHIMLNGVAVDAANRPGYRELFSAIFSDFHLFDALLGLDGGDLDARANELIGRLDLNSKVTAENHAFSTIDLSLGQRKRLALVTLLLEDRPFIVLDEWAADQDPSHREIFYREILPELKRRGKTIIVISHDDRYFHLADRVLRMMDGEIVSDARIAQGGEATEAVALARTGAISE
jgi:putative ATP-binding cassette transporter